jgi:hypothetical protein
MQHHAACGPWLDCSLLICGVMKKGNRELCLVEGHESFFAFCSWRELRWGWNGVGRWVMGDEGMERADFEIGM